MNTKRLATWVILCSLFWTVSALAQKVAKTISFSIVETSDVHGNYFPYDFINGKPGEGSLSRVSTYVKQLRKERGNHRILLVDNGDILQQTSLGDVVYGCRSGYFGAFGFKFGRRK